MPIENEIKYILSNKIIPEIFKYKPVVINQSYLMIDDQSCVRIREVSYSPTKAEHYLTFKTMVDNECVEIEKLISFNDYVKLEKISINKLSKMRFSFENEIDYWCVDIFFEQHSTGTRPYFYLAEVEMPEGETTPSFMPEIVEKYLLKRVTDNSCSNTLLSNIRYAESLLNACKQETLGL